MQQMTARASSGSTPAGHPIPKTPPEPGVGAPLLSRRLLEGRAGVQCRRTPQVARLRLVVWPAAMHGAAIVPDDQVADLPAMAVDELIVRRVRRQIPQQQTPFGHRPAEDVRGMRGE